MHPENVVVEAPPPKDQWRLAGAAAYLAVREAVQDPEMVQASVALAERTAADDGFIYPLNRDELATLVRDNPATGILNPPRYEQIFGPDGSKFKPILFTPSDTVRVMTADGVRVKIPDGHHRAAGNHQYYDKIHQLHPDFEFEIRDLTSEYLPEGSGHNALTMAHYLRIKIPSTMEQEQIASQRVAAELLLGWDDLVGHEIAARFPGLAAFSLLDQRRVQYRRLKDVSALVVDQARYFEDDTPEQREAIRRALIDMAAVIVDSKLQPKTVAEKVFAMVAAQGDNIGGEDNAVRQVLGMFRLPAVAAKMQAYCNTMEMTVAEALAQAEYPLQAILRDGLPRAAFSAVYDAIVNPDISFEQTLTILTTRNHLQAYNTIKAEMTYAVIEAAYIGRHGSEFVLESERRLLAAFAYMAEGSEDELEECLDSIHDAADRLARADTLLALATTSNTGDKAYGHIYSRSEQLAAQMYEARSLPALQELVQQLSQFIETCETLLRTDDMDADTVSDWVDEESATPQPESGHRQDVARKGDGLSDQHTRSRPVQSTGYTPQPSSAGAENSYNTPEDLLRAALGLMARVLASRKERTLELDPTIQRLWRQVTQMMNQRLDD